MSRIVLGLGLSHDTSGVLLRDGRPVVGVQLERLTRVKHDERREHVDRLVDYLLDAAGLHLRDVDSVGVHIPRIYDRSDVAFSRIDMMSDGVLHVGHHLAHAFSAFGPSGFQEAAVLVVDAHGDPYYEQDEDLLVDGVERLATLESAEPVDPAIAPRWETESIYTFTDTGFERHYRNFMQWGRRIGPDGRQVQLGVGLNYRAVALWLFDNMFASGKVMGLAPYGDPLEGLPTSATVDTAGRLRFDDAWSYRIRNELAARPGLARDGAWSAGLAAWIQAETERLMLHLADTALRLSPSRRLATAGGVCLNATTNGRIERDLAPAEFYVQPASSDAGLSLGAAIAADARLTGRIVGAQPRQDALGRRYDDSSVRRALQESTEELTVNTASARTVARELAEGRVVAVFDDGSEFGPRALGRRSILADPRPTGMRDHLNYTVKRREGFRPFAPAVLTEHLDSWFEPGGAGPFMLSTTWVRPDRRSIIPAVTHVDGTARVQCVAPGDGLLRVILEEFYRLTGVPVVLNTSFNGAGDPIVETPEEALQAFIDMGIDLLFIQGHAVRRQGITLDA